MVLKIICADGLDPDLCLKWGLYMPFECAIRVPDELFHIDIKVPFTPHVWGSIFSGKLIRHSFDPSSKINPKRLKIRNFIHRLGIKWQRKGLKIYLHPLEVRSGEIKLKLYLREIDDIIFDHYRSLTYHIPAIDNDYFMGVPEVSALKEWEINKELLSISSNYEVIAVYTRLPDFYGHRIIHEKDYDHLRAWYFRIFHFAKLLKPPVILISDHGCDKVHTFKLYYGSTEPILPKEFLDIRNVIEKILNKDELTPELLAESEIQKSIPTMKEDSN